MKRQRRGWSVVDKEGSLRSADHHRDRTVSPPVFIGLRSNLGLLFLVIMLLRECRARITISEVNQQNNIK